MQAPNSQTQALDPSARLWQAYSWLQEHANLCRIALLFPDSETQTRLQARIHQSFLQGEALIQDAMQSLDETKGEESSHHALEKTHRPSLPISGFHRFDETRVSNGTQRVAQPQMPLERPNISLDRPSFSIAPSRSYKKKES